MSTHTLIVLGISLLLGISGIEAGDAVEVIAAVLAQLVGEGEAEVAPIGVTFGDVYPGRLDTLGDDFNVVTGVGALVRRRASILGSLLLGGLGPFFWIELFFHYLVAYFGLR